MYCALPPASPGRMRLPISAKIHQAFPALPFVKHGETPDVIMSIPYSFPGAGIFPFAEESSGQAVCLRG